MKVLLGRLAFSAIFILSAASHLQDIPGTVAMMGKGNWHGLEAHVPQLFEPEIQTGLAYFSTGLALCGALAILFGGYWCGGLMLAAFLAGVTPVMHWPVDASGAIDQMQMIHFMKNVALFGASLLIASNEKGTCPTSDSKSKAKKA